LLAVASGGGGYGDPLERNPGRVYRDFLLGLCSAATVRDLYGVVIGGESKALDLFATEERRRALRALRLQEGKPADPETVSAARPDPEALKRLDPIGDCLTRVEYSGEILYICSRCGHPYGGLRDDPKRHALMREVPITAFSEWNRYGLVAGVIALEFYCPGCALMIGVQVRRKGDPPLWDMSLRPPTGAGPCGA
ncbi:MAG: hypothetical protein HYV08_05905, partial [Deltaproteobacteria bacterium]|nr:hypothetical protein [Deltaproteobacteria bacterium]